MKKKIVVWQLAGFLFTALGGILLHFLYDWTGQSVLVAPFSAVNESTWEHMKLLYFPMFLFGLIQSQFFREYENFWCVRLAGTVAGLTLIPVLFYTYNGALGKSPDWINITIFFISAAAAFLLENRLFKKGTPWCRFPRLAFIIFYLIGLLFVIFTFVTPRLPIFMDPLTRSP